MPVYNFVCPTCGLRFDQRFSFHDDVQHISCPRGHSGARRIFSPPTIVFKGSGFYVNDSRKSSVKEHSGD